jgi:hypothetical protein
MSTSDKFFVPLEVNGIEPIACTIPRTSHLTGESRSKVYELLGDGTYTGVKAGRRTLILYESIKRRFAALPRANIAAPKPRPPRAVTEDPPRPRRGRKPKHAATTSSSAES